MPFSSHCWGIFELKSHCLPYRFRFSFRPALDSIECRTSWQDLRILDVGTKWRGSWHTRRSDLTLSCRMSHKSREKHLFRKVRQKGILIPGHEPSKHKGLLLPGLRRTRQTTRTRSQRKGNKIASWHASAVEEKKQYKSPWDICRRSPSANTNADTLEKNETKWNGGK